MIMQVVQTVTGLLSGHKLCAEYLLIGCVPMIHEYLCAKYKYMIVYNLMFVNNCGMQTSLIKVTYIWQIVQHQLLKTQKCKRLRVNFKCCFLSFFTIYSSLRQDFLYVLMCACVRVCMPACVCDVCALCKYRLKLGHRVIMSGRCIFLYTKACHLLQTHSNLAMFVQGTGLTGRMSPFSEHFCSITSLKQCCKNSCCVRYSPTQ